jgi:hypothetical protein
MPPDDAELLRGRGEAQFDRRIGNPEFVGNRHDRSWVGTSRSASRSFSVNRPGRSLVMRSLLFPIIAANFVVVS